MRFMGITRLNEKGKELSRRSFLSCLAKGAGLTALSGFVGLIGCSESASKKDEEDELRATLFSYLCNPDFRSSDFFEQISGTKTRFLRCDSEEGSLYFYIPKQHFNNGVLERITKNPAGVVGIESGGNYLFAFPSNELIADPDAVVKKEFGKFVYSISLRELSDFLFNRSIYGGNLHIVRGKDTHGRNIILPNHGALVAKVGEPSVERLACQITGGRLDSAQSLLDFVSENINYSDIEAAGRFETLKRPNEVFLTGNSDCSGKAIALCSLYEQAGIPQLLVYLKDVVGLCHVAPAIQGDYSSRNGLNFEYDGERYFIAESTAEGFQIGKSKLNRDFDIRNIRYVQRPGADSKIIDLKTGEELPPSK